MKSRIVKYESKIDFAFAKANLSCYILHMKNAEKSLEPSKSPDTEEKQNTVETDEKEQPSFTERWKNSRYLFIRGTYLVAHSIWTVVMVIGMAIAWLVAVLAT